jgi:hypothetical protein
VGPSPDEAEGVFDVDWVSVFLGLVAFMSIGGLLVLWFFIYLKWTTPIVP